MWGSTTMQAPVGAATARFELSFQFRFRPAATPGCADLPHGRRIRATRGRALPYVVNPTVGYEYFGNIEARGGLFFGPPFAFLRP